MARLKAKRKSNNGKFFTPKVIVSGMILVIILICALFPTLLAPYDPNATDFEASFCKAFTPGHWLGTDRLGRDLLSRIICGAQTSLLNAFMIVGIEVLLGVPIGMLCGYFGGFFDDIIMRVWDIVCAIPSLLLAFVLVGALGTGTISGVIALGIVYTPLTAKLARSLTMTEKASVYVEAARSMGYSNKRILFRHILPNVATTMITQFTLDIGSAITAMASLSYLGLGTQAPDADWGTLLKDGMGLLNQNVICLTAPAFVILVTSVSINLLSDGIQAYIDPSQRKMPTFKEYRKKQAKMVAKQEKLQSVTAK
ncbi:ABC transporter permease [Anaerosporobacter sp.]|uniref:ABC transporter permease n=1 Tax=Anaerosporobacter sp. TaxID=1872529 RepID=UPI00286ED080|nr:ABC transporter permease [Anaerosporobacter sp.]